MRNCSKWQTCNCCSDAKEPASASPWCWPLAGVFVPDCCCWTRAASPVELLDVTAGVEDWPPPPAPEDCWPEEGKDEAIDNKDVAMRGLLSDTLPLCGCCCFLASMNGGRQAAETARRRRKLPISQGIGEKPKGEGCTGTGNLRQAKPGVCQRNGDDEKVAPVKRRVDNCWPGIHSAALLWGLSAVAEAAMPLGNRRMPKWSSHHQLRFGVGHFALLLFV